MRTGEIEHLVAFEKPMTVPTTGTENGGGKRKTSKRWIPYRLRQARLCIPLWSRIWDCWFGRTTCFMQLQCQGQVFGWCRAWRCKWSHESNRTIIVDASEIINVIHMSKWIKSTVNCIDTLRCSCASTVTFSKDCEMTSGWNRLKKCRGVGESVSNHCWIQVRLQDMKGWYHTVCCIACRESSASPELRVEYSPASILPFPTT